MLVSDIDERMSSAEFLHWQMYYARKAQREELQVNRAKAGGHG